MLSMRGTFFRPVGGGDLHHSMEPSTSTMCTSNADDPAISRASTNGDGISSSDLIHSTAASSLGFLTAAAAGARFLGPIVELVGRFADGAAPHTLECARFRDKAIRTRL